MLKVYACVTDQHDLRLVALAAVICVVSAYTALGLLLRARGRTGTAHHGWLAAAVTVTGFGVWATHFVAMLAFQPGVPIGYDFGQTMLSIAIAMVVTWVGFAVALRLSAPIVGGIVVGGGIGAMHFAGMEAVSIAAHIEWDVTLAMIALLIGVVFGAAALSVALAGAPRRARVVAATVLLTLAISGLHFTAMAAVSFQPDPFLAVPEEFTAPQWLSAAIAMAMALIVALGALGDAADRRLRQRAAEAERMRTHILALEQTQRRLEATTTDLHKALEEAAAASQAKSQFLATMSHELRTPLNAVIGFAEILATGKFGPIGDRYQDYADSICHSAQHLLGLINDILDFSKIDAGRVDLDEEELDLNVVAAEAIAMVETQAAHAGVTVDPGFAAEPPHVRADQRRVRQVVLNLLSNAIKFTPRGGRVRVSTADAPPGPSLTVADTGIGIATGDIARAFEPFGQIDNRLARKYDGAGLGLPLSRRLMEMHGGTLEMQSLVGVGTSVTATFPAARRIGYRKAG